MLWRYSLLFAAQFGSVIGNGQHVLGSSGDGLNRIRDKYKGPKPPVTHHS